MHGTGGKGRGNVAQSGWPGLPREYEEELYLRVIGPPLVVCAAKPHTGAPEQSHSPARGSADSK